MSGICFCASGCALNLMADPGVFGDDCSCWCHKQTTRKPPAEEQPDACGARPCRDGDHYGQCSSPTAAVLGRHQGGAR
jgi:hypothetical protein